MPDFKTINWHSKVELAIFLVLRTSLALVQLQVGI
jgi:hypothetical protein